MLLKRIGHFTQWLLAVVLPFIVLSFSNGNQVVKADNYKIELKGDVAFVIEEDVVKTIENLKDSTQSINIRLLEERLSVMNGVIEAEVFSNLGKELTIVLQQGTPIIRLFDSGRSYYLNEFGEQMALSPYYSARVPLVSGSLNGENEKQIHELFMYIRSDSLLSKLIDAAEVDAKAQWILYSNLKGHEVLLGDISQWQEKLEAFKAFYSHVVLTKKREDFKRLDLRFKSQVILIN
jgi:cell division protein FtsQ